MCLTELLTFMIFGLNLKTSEAAARLRHQVQNHLVLPLPMETLLLLLHCSQQARMLGKLALPHWHDSPNSFLLCDVLIKKNRGVYEVKSYSPIWYLKRR